ncbi:hypothetical protein OXPF_28220 [Oxobacter pfennigii]|uniref:ECF transporter S component n=1 Tax=Oxobacter pfennigii TaxID=36849 RepID=A0A0P8WLP7_9CLOT|nr:ECF transporter S component [Oxobacter pfennigii]KPU43381.1 hypothetical protein OXPF_28220 [Oxobacter pfennigii]
MNTSTKNLVKAALFLACAVLLPTVFHTFRLGGQIFLPMHIPILIAAFMIPWEYAAITGFLAPLLSFLITGMPPMPSGIVMMLELTVYGAAASLLFNKYKSNLYIALILSMLSGRLVSITGNWILTALVMGKAFNFIAFMNSLFIVALPGIIIQLILVPIIVKLVKKSEKAPHNVKEAV